MTDRPEPTDRSIIVNAEIQMTEHATAAAERRLEAARQIAAAEQTGESVWSFVSDETPSYSDIIEAVDAFNAFPPSRHA